MILLALALGYLYIYPTWTGVISTDQQQIASYNSALDGALKFSDQEKQLITQSNAISPSNLMRLQEYMPDGVDNIQLILDLDQLARRYGVGLSDFAIQNNSTDGTDSTAAAPGNPDSGSTALQSEGATNSLDLTVTATGSYDSFQAFLTAAELSLRPLDVMKLGLVSTNTGIYTYTMTFRIYWLP
jgi:hypothetical protein